MALPASGCFLSALAAAILALLGIGLFAGNATTAMTPMPFDFEGEALAMPTESVPIEGQAQVMSTMSAPIESQAQVMPTVLPPDLVSDPRPNFEEMIATAEGDLEFGWELFLYINQPQTSLPGTPLLWQTWKQSTDVYLACGVTPTPWGTNSDVPPDVASAAEAAGLSTAFYTYLPSDEQIDGRELLDTNNVPVRFEVRMNESTFTTIYNLDFYNRDVQVNYFENPTTQAPLQFDPQALEIKATWRVFQSGESTAGFYTTTGYYYDENNQPVVFTAGLTGLHISSKVTENWFWVTFEQVDNQITTQAPLVDPIPADVEIANQEVHATLPSNSVWQNYNMRGVQWVFTEPMLLANTQVETYFQSSSSCITCHFTATIGSEQDGRLFFFQFVDGDLEGYVGDPRSMTFYTADDSEVFYNGEFGFIDNNDILRYRQLDFVWSLREAQPSCQ